MSDTIFIEHPPERRGPIWRPDMPESVRPSVWRNANDISESVDSVTVQPDTIIVTTNDLTILARHTGESQPGLVIGEIERVETRGDTP